MIKIQLFVSMNWALAPRLFITKPTASMARKLFNPLLSMTVAPQPLELTELGSWWLMVVYALNWREQAESIFLQRLEIMLQIWSPKSGWGQSGGGSIGVGLDLVWILFALFFWYFWWGWYVGENGIRWQCHRSWAWFGFNFVCSFLLELLMGLVRQWERYNKSRAL